jgi:hypothetical protein
MITERSIIWKKMRKEKQSTRRRGEKGKGKNEREEKQVLSIHSFPISES